MLDEACNEVDTANGNLPSVPAHMAARTFGGIPYVGISGYSNQLPPVGSKSVSDRSVGTLGSADALGRIVLSEI